MTVTLTEEQILREYWTYWCRQMRQAGRPEAEITPQGCIDDFVVVNWAERVE